MDHKSQQHTQKDRNMRQRSVGESFTGGQNLVAGIRDPSISPTTSSKKLFRQGFLNWVAYHRSLALDGRDPLQRTCPVANCEKRLDSELQMRKHLMECLHLEKGLYRCHETGDIGRIGKCETYDCRDLQQYKSLFSNAMHTLGRRLSPRGCRPNRLVKKISNKQPTPSYMFGVDPRIPYSELDWEARVKNSDASPEYTPFSSEWKQTHVAELSSSREAGELSADHGFTELDVGYATTNTEYGEQATNSFAELGVSDDDSTQVSQFLAHGTYQPAELPTAIHSPFVHQNNEAGQSTHAGDWNSTNSNYGTISKELLNIPYLKSGTFMGDNPMTDTQRQRTPPISSATQSSIHNDVAPATESRDWNITYNSTCIISPIQSFTESDMEGRSVFTPSPSLITNRTSISSINSVKTPQDVVTTNSFSFFDESDRMCQEPDEFFEPSEFIKDYQWSSHQSLDSFDEPDRICRKAVRDDIHLAQTTPTLTHQSNVSILTASWNSKYNSTTNKHFSPTTTRYSGALHENYETQPQLQLISNSDASFQHPARMSPHRITRKPVASSSLEKELVEQILPDVDYSTKIATYFQSPEKPTPYHCEYCSHRFTDKSNLKRHIKFSCKERPGYRMDKKNKPFKCDFPDCKSSGYTLSHNLLVHQKKQGHFSTTLLHQLSITDSQPLSQV